jgi:hypothetical protein
MDCKTRQKRVYQVIEITNKMRPCSRIYYFHCLLIAQHVSSDTPLIIRSSKTLIAASGFTCVCGCRQLPATTNLCKCLQCCGSQCILGGNGIHPTVLLFPSQILPIIKLYETKLFVQSLHFAQLHLFSFRF